MKRNLLQKDIYFADFDKKACSEERKKKLSFEGFEHCFCTFIALLMKASSQTCYCWNTALPMEKVDLTTCRVQAGVWRQPLPVP